MTSFLDFPNEAKCRAAADAVGGTSQVSLGQRGNHPYLAFGDLPHRCTLRRALMHGLVSDFDTQAAEAGKGALLGVAAAERNLNPDRRWRVSTPRVLDEAGMQPNGRDLF